MATQGEVFSTERIRTLKATYFRIALDLVESYHNDAVFNGLSYDRHKESKAIEVFAEKCHASGARLSRQSDGNTLYAKLETGCFGNSRYL